VEGTKLVGDELQASEVEALGRLKWWRRPLPCTGDSGELQSAKANHLALACRQSGDGSR